MSSRKSSLPLKTPGISGRATIGVPLAGHGQTVATGNQDPAVAAERLHRAGQFKEAEKQYRQILKGRPDHPRVNALLGMLLSRQDKFQEAVKLFKKSLRKAPDDVEAWNGLGTALRSQGKLNEAIDAYGEAIKRDPDFAGVYNNLGTAFREAGQFDEAMVQYEKALAIDPNLPEAWNGYARVRRFEEMPKAVDQLKVAASSEKINAQARKHAQFALGKIHDDLGLYDEAFAHYAAANELRSHPANTEPDTRMMARMASLYAGPPDVSVSDDGREPTPVLVLGMPRSGTTLVEQILASHPAITGGGELHYFTEVAKDLGVDRNTTSISDDLPDEIAKKANHLRRGFFRRFAPEGKRLPKRVAAVVDKTPFNFLYLGLIAQILPDAKIVHCTRDPLDTGLSIYFTDFAASQPFTTDLAAIGEYIVAYQALMGHWREASPLPILELPYRDMVEDQERSTRQLVEFCGLPWDDQCLNYHKTQRYISTPSDWQVRQPIYDRSIGRWRHYEKHIEPLRSVVEKSVA